MRSIIFTIPGIPQVVVQAVEQDDGSILFNLTVEGDGDLRGFFFDVTGIDAGLVITGDDVTDQDEDTINLGGGVNMNGDGRDDYDIAAEFGTSGTGEDQITSTSFTLTTDDGSPLTLDAIAHMEFGARITSIDGSGSAKNTTIAPAAPDAIDDQATVLEDTEITIDALSNDTDADGDDLTITSVDDPANGSAQIVDNKLVYQADEHWSGTDYITYSISDGDGGTDTATVEVTVEAVADAPNLSLAVLSGDNVQEVVLEITSSLVDTDGSESLSLALSGIPAGVTLEGASYDAVNGWTIENPTGLDLVTVVLPEDMDFDFDIQVDAISTEASNGDTATTTASQGIVMTYNTVSQQVVMEANDQSQWGGGEEFTFDDERSLGFDTGSKTGSTELFGVLDFGYSVNIEAGISSDLHFGGGSIDADVPYDLNFATTYNETTDVLAIETSAFLAAGGGFMTDGPNLTYDLDFYYDLYANASLDVDVLTGWEVFDTTFINVDGTYPIISYDSDTNDGIEIGLPAGFSGSLQWPTVEVEGVEGITGSYSGSETSNNFLELGLDVDDFLSTLLFGGVNPVSYSASIEALGVTAASISLDIIDIDLSTGLSFGQEFDMEVGSLTSVLVFEDGSEQVFTVGDELVFDNASTLDANNDGDIEFTFRLDVDDTMVTNDTDLDFNVGWSVEALEGSYTLGTGGDSFGPLLDLGTPQIKVAEVSVYDSEFELDFTEQEFLLVA